MKYMSNTCASHSGWETKKGGGVSIMSGVDKERSPFSGCQVSLLPETVVSLCERTGELSHHSEGLLESLLSLRRYL